MMRLIRACTYLKYLGLLGLLQFLFDSPAFSYFWFFFLLGFIEIFAQPRVFWQSCQMPAGTAALTPRPRKHEIAASQAGPGNINREGAVAKQPLPYLIAIYSLRPGACGPSGTAAFSAGADFWV